MSRAFTPFESKSVESKSVAAHAFIIEVKSHTAGIVVRDGRGFRFHAASDDFSGLEGQGFRSPGDAQKAALKLVERLSGGRNLKLGAA
jgi:hypothetical protein